MKLTANKSSIAVQLQHAIAEAVNSVQGSSLKPEEVGLEHPTREEYGDYATNVALKLKAKSLKLKAETLKSKLFKPRSINNPSASLRTSQQPAINNPQELAQAIKVELEKQKIPVIGGMYAVNGFINISIKTSWLISQLDKVLKDADCYGLAPETGKTIIVEFAHPNTHKLFHIGHLRNIITGESIVRILKANGDKVIRANYQGDVGLHIAKCIWGIKKRFMIFDLGFKNLDEKIEFLGKCYVEGNKAYEEDEKAKKEIISINKKIYDKSDEEINKLWKETRSWSLEYFDRVYKRVYSHFDRFYFESEVYQKGKKIALEFLKKGVLAKSKGAVIFPGKKYGLHDRVFLNSAGNPTYEAKDLRLCQLQFGEYHPDLIIHVVSKEQTGYFQVIFKALEKIFPQSKGKEFHLEYGWVNLKEGKMSSRTGNVVLGEWLLDKAKTKIKSIMDKVAKGGKVADREAIAEALAVAAVKYSFLRQGVGKDIAFDFEESVSFEGNSGPYLVYTYARCKSVLEKAGKFNQLVKLEKFELNPEELAVLRTLYRFPEVVKEAGSQYNPSLIGTFLYDLAGKYNTFYNKHSILTPKETQTRVVSNFRLSLTAATAQVLKNGLNLLGIKAVEKM